MPNYNPYFPATYQPYTNYPISYQPPVTTQTQPNQTGIVWVQGEAGAKAYPVAAGTSMLLMDSENEQFYIKTTDASGMPAPLRVFSYKEVVQTTKTPVTNDIDVSKFITREELESRLEALKTPSNRKIRKEDGENE